MEYTLTRSKRKTLSLMVRGDGSVDVRAPMKLPNAQIQQFVEQHQDWVRKQQAILLETAQQKRRFDYADGERFPIAGEERTLAAGTGRRGQLEADLLRLPPDNRPQVLADYLRQEARQRVTQRISVFAPLMGVAPAGIKITSATTRWGSCSGKNSLCFAYRIACLPPELLDYIVVHELAHIQEHNHSPRFWAVVGKFMPDWPARRSQLRAFQSQIPI